MHLPSLALWVLVLALSLQTGAGIFETRVLVHLWSASPPESVAAFFAQPVRPDSGRRNYVRAAALIVAWLAALKAFGC